MELNKQAVAYLNAVLGYNNDIPDAPITRSHRMDDKPWRTTAGKSTGPKLKNIPAPRATAKILDFIKSNPGADSVKIASNVFLTRGRVSNILGKMYGSGLVTRVRVATPTGTMYQYKAA